MQCTMLLLSAVLCIMNWLVVEVDAANILMIPMLNSSHYLEMDGVGRPLVERGHTVYVLLDDRTTIPNAAPYTIVSYRSHHDKSYHADSKAKQKYIENSQAGMNMADLAQEIKDLCVDMMIDTELFPKLTSLKLDLAVVDNGLIPCYYLVPYKLGIPIVTVGSLLLSWPARVPILPSVVQPILSLDAFGVQFCEETEQQWSIVRRICRMVSLLTTETFFATFDTEYMREYVEYPSINEIKENVSLRLINSAHYLSTALPKLPHVEYVGGLTTRPAKPLEDSLEMWMSLAANVVVVSFGSMHDSLPSGISAKLLQAFGRLSQLRFLIRYKLAESATLNVPVNVRLMDWLPQNDALGHNSTLAFVTHSGNNGQQEALYHGVPMLCFYFHADQKTNARRAVQRGFGKMIDIHDFTVDQLIAELSDLIDNPSFTQRIKKASRIFHSEKHPSERAADAVEHVLKYGSDHLRPKEAYKLSWWQFYMLDVLVVIYFVTVLVVVVVVRVLKCVLCCLIRRIGGSKQKAKVD